LAQLCFCRNQFLELYPNAYNAACKHGWLDEICSHMNRLIDFYIVEEYIIYVYEDEINHCAYVGLTNNKKRRDYEHLMNKADSLYKYCRKYDIPVPEMKVLIENLSATEAQKEEKRMWYKYRDEGWTMINSEKSLGYLGTSAKYLKKVK